MKQNEENYNTMVTFILEQPEWTLRIIAGIHEVDPHTVWNWTRGTVPQSLRVRRWIKRTYKSLLANQGNKL